MRNSAILPGLSAGNRRATGKLLKTPFSVKFDAERRVVHVWLAKGHWVQMWATRH
jgi:hypothetical protein